jgi:hypothetical protein
MCVKRGPRIHILNTYIEVQIQPGRSDLTCRAMPYLRNESKRHRLYAVATTALGRLCRIQQLLCSANKLTRTETKTFSEQ